MTYTNALIFATNWHYDQIRKYTGEPYIVHPIEVSMICREYGLGDDAEIAALLHDVLEDTDCDERSMREYFGGVVADIVVALTDKETGNRAERKRLSALRIAQSSEIAQAVKCADLISNTKDICAHDPNFAKIYLAEKRQLLDMMTLRHPIYYHAISQITANPSAAKQYPELS